MIPDEDLEKFEEWFALLPIEFLDDKATLQLGWFACVQRRIIDGA